MSDYVNSMMSIASILDDNALIDSSSDDIGSGVERCGRSSIEEQSITIQYGASENINESSASAQNGIMNDSGNDL